MDDRKRPGGPDDSAPPAKRQAVTMNGAKAHSEDIPWKDDIEVRPLPASASPGRSTTHAASNTVSVQAYQKDAILRQMREYKREKNTVEQELRDIEKRAKFHDEHLRTIDSWFEQVSTFGARVAGIDADQGCS